MTLARVPLGVNQPGVVHHVVAVQMGKEQPVNLSRHDPGLQQADDALPLQTQVGMA